MNDHQATQAKIEAVVGAGLMTTPFWVSAFQEANLIASTLAAICGAIIGIHAVWRLWCRHCDERGGK